MCSAQVARRQVAVTGYSVIEPAVETLPKYPSWPVNHKLPSGPLVMYDRHADIFLRERPRCDPSA
jgi:hypothetical protein